MVRSRWYRQHRDGGAVAVEFALIFPIFALFVFGLITSAFAFSTKQGITQGVREGARYAATLPIPGTPTWLGQVFTATEASAATELGTKASVCVAYIPAGASPMAAVRRRTAGGAPATSTGVGIANSCIPSDTSRLDARVQVVIERPYKFDLVVAPLANITLRASSVTLYERSTL